MKLKLLLFFLLISGGVLQAQDTIRSLIISEALRVGVDNTYAEITNMGDKPVDLNQIKWGKIAPWSTAINDVYVDPWDPGTDWFYLPEVTLAPGESYVITTAFDFGPAQYNKKVPGFTNPQYKQPELYELADLLIHVAEPKGDETDSVTTYISPKGGGNIEPGFTNWRGRSAWYLEQHLSETDSVVIDQVGGVFDNEGHNRDVGYAVAGVEGAVSNSILVRKYSVKSGNLNFADARGVGLEDSEWIPIKFPASSWRDVFWTVGNHGDYNLDENTLESDVIDVDFANKKLIVPWGIRRTDGIMHQMKRKPGIAWEYVLNPNVEDSLTFAARTGDQIIIYVCGNDLDVATFDIEVAAPTADANIVVPVSNVDAGPNAWWRDDNQQAYVDWPWVTEHESGIDTITGVLFGIPYATRADSLLERLEKAPNATWSFDYVDGVERPDLKNGDKLVVTAENGDVKEYYIQMRPYDPNHNAYLSAITWPDIPSFYRDIFGWMGDTIPNFNATTYNYRVQVPFDVDGIPALVAKTQNLNAKVDVSRATTLAGTVDQRTVKYTVTAEDDSVVNTYNIELIKEKDFSKIQPYEAEPFLSEFVFWDQWDNGFAEIMNPGNQPLDLSNYMIAMNWINSPADMISSSGAPENWGDRYTKYVPGYKWVDEATWAISPATLVQDLNVNPIVQPGDVFALGDIRTEGSAHPDWLPDYVWPVPAQLDVQFNNLNDQIHNPWGEPIAKDKSPVRQWSNSEWYLFKILNDSIKLGLKPATDPNDFELIEVWGMGESTDWVIGGKTVPMISNWIRKPEIYKGNPEYKGSFGTTPEDAEWTYTDRPYWQARNAGWPMEILNIGNDVGQHFMYTPTHYMSTVTSVVYKVSDGYSMNEEIRGVRTGQTVADLFSNVVKANENQVLKVKSTADGIELAMDALLNMNDTLVVLSADSTNTTKYRLDVTEAGLNSDAVLESSKYDIEITQQPSAVIEDNNAAEMGKATISGFEYGTQINTLLANITVPSGASLTVIDGEGAYVPLTMLNFDTSYVSVTVNHNTYFEVVAEDGITSILYQLQPQASESSAFLTSDVYSVDQRDLLIEYVPRGTSVNAFLSNVVPSVGASIKIVDKSGLERVDGQIYQDDKVVVTSPNGEVKTVYYLSMLRTAYIQSTTYLAYVTSNVYTVDQVNMTIEGGLSGDTELSTFYSRITPATGATAVVTDANGVEKNSGTLAAGDMVKVTSADGMVEVMYEISFAVSAKLNNALNFQLYPNPTSGKVNISGVKAGERIRVFNSMGANVSDIKVQSNLETISLDNQPAGMYMIVISDQDQTLGKYKVMKR